MAKNVKELFFQLSAKLGPTFTTAFTNANTQVARLAQKMGVATAKGKSLSDSGGKIAQAFRGVVTGSAGLAAQIQKLNTAYIQGSIDSAKYVRELAKLEKQLKKVEQAKATGQALRAKLPEVNAKRNAAAANVMHQGAMLYGMAQPIRDAIEFESVMADVRKVVQFDTPEQFKQMSADVLELSTRLPMAAEGIARIAAAGGQAGIAREDLMQFAEQAAKMGIAYNITADEAGEMMAKWRTAFKMDQDAVGVLADQVNYLGNNTAASAPKIADVVTRIGPLAEVGGVAARDVAALGASVVGAGVDSERAATGVKNLILALTAGESATKSQGEAFKALGLDAVAVSKKMQVDAKGAINDVLKALQGLNKEDQATALTQLFGKESVAAIAPLLTNLAALQTNFEAVSNAQIYGGSVNAEYAAKCQTVQNQLTLLKNATTKLGTEIGAGLLPVVNNVVGAVVGFAGWLNNLNSIIPGFTSYVYGGAMALIGATVAFNAMTWVVNVWKGAIIGARIVWAAMKSITIGQTVVTWAQTAAQWALNTAMIVGAAPIYAIIAAIAAAIAIGWLIYDNWGKISEFAATCWDAGKQAIADFCDKIREKIGAIVEWISEKWNLVKSLFGSPIKAEVQATASGNGKAVGVARNAAGGIYERGEFLTTFAEEGPEAAIPIDGSPRAVSLWQQTGRMMGLISEKHEGGGVVATFAPTINVQGGADVNGIDRILRERLAEFERMLERKASDRKRVAYV